MPECFCRKSSLRCFREFPISLRRGSSGPRQVGSRRATVPSPSRFGQPQPSPRFRGGLPPWRLHASSCSAARAEACELFLPSPDKLRTVSTVLQGKKGVVFGVANNRSIAWAVCEAAKQHGAEVCIGVQNERMAESVSKLFEGDAFDIVIADLNVDSQIEAAADKLSSRFGKLDFAVHSVAYAL